MLNAPDQTLNILTVVVVILIITDNPWSSNYAKRRDLQTQAQIIPIQHIQAGMAFVKITQNVTKQNIPNNQLAPAAIQPASNMDGYYLGIPERELYHTKHLDERAHEGTAFTKRKSSPKTMKPYEVTIEEEKQGPIIMSAIYSLLICYKKN